MSRPRCVCRHSVIMRVVSAVGRLSSRPIVDGLLIAVGHIVVELLKLPASEDRKVTPVKFHRRNLTAHVAPERLVYVNSQRPLSLNKCTVLLRKM